ncbi:MAG TPA: thiol reductant ABC exporter subunit CydC [Xanthobacteraceae bacterium]|nr:thiol reductant ABC exporter subunit CydC [Xanthobacteraceae bacterium]
MSGIWYFRALFRRHAPRLALALLLSLAALAAGVALLGVSGWFLTATALTAAAASINLFAASSLIRGFSLARILARYGERLVGHDTTLRLLSDLRGWLFRTLFPRVPLAERGLRHGDLVSRLTADIDALDTVFLVGLSPILAALALGSAVAAGLFVLLPPAGFIYAAALAGATLGVPAVLILAARRPGRAIVAASAELRTAVLDGMDGHADLVAFGATQDARRGFLAAAQALGAGRRRLGGRGALAAGAVQGLAAIALTGVLVFGLKALKAGTLDGPWLVGLLLATLGSFEATAAIVRSIAKLGTAAAAAERLKALASAAPAVSDPAYPAPLPEGADLAFENVTFGHDPRRPVLRRLWLEVPAGSRIALVGPSGAGKSTLLALLLRLRDPQAGTVRVAGTDVRTIAQADLHRRVALLAQDAPVFLGTLRDNLRIGDPEADDDRLWAALGAARLADFVRALPEGLDARVGETGRTLSAGQARRLCLARTLLSPAAILAFDEPTSGLDRETELAFLADLSAATAGRTVLIATHAGLPPGAVDRTLRLTEAGVLVAA